MTVRREVRTDWGAQVAHEEMCVLHALMEPAHGARAASLPSLTTTTP
jgi:hypothetical protein